jgi:hypothetical protein
VTSRGSNYLGGQPSSLSLQLSPREARHTGDFLDIEMHPVKGILRGLDPYPTRGLGSRSFTEPTRDFGRVVAGYFAGSGHEGFRVMGRVKGILSAIYSILGAEIAYLEDEIVYLGVDLKAVLEILAMFSHN